MIQVRSIILDKLRKNIFKKKENSENMLDEVLVKLLINLHILKFK